MSDHETMERFKSVASEILGRGSEPEEMPVIEPPPIDVERKDSAARKELSERISNLSKALTELRDKGTACLRSGLSKDQEIERSVRELEERIDHKIKEMKGEEPSFHAHPVLVLILIVAIFLSSFGIMISDKRYEKIKAMESSIQRMNTNIQRMSTKHNSLKTSER